MTRSSALTAIRLCAVLTVAAAVIFSLFPGIDLWFSGLFSDETGFPLNGDADLQAFREAVWLASIAFCLFAVATLLLMSLRRPPSQRIGNRIWGFVVATYVLAPGIMANVLLKEHWGRARPRSITEFGGEKTFTMALDATDQCARNCSFVSGEASGVVATAMILTLLLAPGMRSALRWPFAGIVWLSAVYTSLLRVAMGGHFLSDVTFGALFTALIALALFLLLRLDREPPVTIPKIWHDLHDALLPGKRP